MPRFSARMLTRLTGRFRLPCRRFRNDEKGATAVEFSIVALPFFALIFAVIETSLVFFASQTLETAVGDASRLVLTGQAQKQSLDKEQFKSAVCSRISALFDCQGGVLVDVQCHSSFAGADVSRPVDADGNLKTEFSFCPGEPGEIVVVRGIYLWPVWVKLLGFNLADMPNGKRLLVATSVFRNEPYK